MLFAQEHRQVAELEELDLGEIDLEILADVKDLPDDLVGEVKHLLAQCAVSSLLAVASNKQRRKLEAHANRPGAVVAIMLTGVQEAKVGNVIRLRELLCLCQLGNTVVAGKNDRAIEVLVAA